MTCSRSAGSADAIEVPTDRGDKMSQLTNDPDLTAPRQPRRESPLVHVVHASGPRE